MKKLQNILIAAIGILPSIAIAHPGHGHENPLSPGHYLGNPEHGIPIALTLAAVAIVGIWQWRKATHKK